MTKVLARTIAISSNDERFPLSVVTNIEFVSVLNWCSSAGFLIYAEEGLKRYCLWSVTLLLQHRGNLYRDSRVANELETIADPTRIFAKELDSRLRGNERMWR
jgi:hypothetical protein